MTTVSTHDGSGRTATLSTHVDVSVIVPTRNRSALLATTLQSVFSQRDVHIEVIVVDEASTDDTTAQLRAVADPRLRVIRHDAPLGLPAARNRGAVDARGEWLAFIDDDDLWAPDKLARQLQAARQTRRDWVYTGAVNFEERRIVHSRPLLPPDRVVAAVPRYNAIPGGGSNVILHRSAWTLVGCFDTRFPAGGEDWELTIRLAKHGPPAWVCSPLVAKRIHPSNMSLDVPGSMQAARFIEMLHNTKVDWGMTHRWVAHSHLRSGRRVTALRHFALAAMNGQRRGALRDLGNTLVPRLLGRRWFPVQDRRDVDDAWKDEAIAWLRQFVAGIH